jgi:hypothetical protein
VESSNARCHWSVPECVNGAILERRQRLILKHLVSLSHPARRRLKLNHLTPNPPGTNRSELMLICAEKHHSLSKRKALNVSPTLIHMPPSPKPDDHLMDSREVADLLNVDISWVRNHCTATAPLLPHVKLGGGRYATRRFRRSDIIQFIEEHFVRPKLRKR